jgi:Flp pilus assembly protein TadB
MFSDNTNKSLNFKNKKALKIFVFLMISSFAFLLIFTFPSIAAADTPQETQGENQAVIPSQLGEAFIKEVDTAGFPNINLYLSFKEGSHLGLKDLGKNDFIIKENNQEIKDFTVKKIGETDEPIATVLVIDTSGSMKGDPINNAKNAAVSFIDNMRDIDKVAIVGFADTVTEYCTFTSDKTVLKKSIEAMSSKGETSLFDGIIKGIDMFNNMDAVKHQYMLVLSDGTDTVSTATAAAAVAIASSSNMTIYSIALLSNEFNPSDLETIAKSTNGALLTTADPEQLTNLYSDISKKIRNQYKITFKSLSTNIEKFNAIVSIDSSGIKDSINISYENPFFTQSGSGAVTNAQSSQVMTEIVIFDKWWVMALVYLFIFISITILLYIVSTIMIPGKPGLKNRMDHYLYNAGDINTSAEPMEKTRRLGLFSRLKKKNRKNAGINSFAEVFEIKLRRAGMSISGRRFLTLHVVAVGISTLLVYVLTKNLILTFAVIMLVTFFPFLLINFKTGQRIKKFNEQLPDTLQLVEGALKAGYSLNQSLAMVLKETKPPISEEFKITMSEIRMGLSEKDALENMAKRINSELFTWVVMAINIQRDVGGNLAEIMDIIANTIREKEKVLRQIKALVSEGKISAYVLIGLPIVMAIALSIMNKGYISVLFTTKIGYLMLGVAVSLMIAGIAWILKIIKIDY